MKNLNKILALTAISALSLTAQAETPALELNPASKKQLTEVKSQKAEMRAKQAMKAKQIRKAKKGGKKAVKAQAAEDGVLGSWSFANLKAGTETDPVMIELEEDANGNALIPEDLIGAENYGWGGSGLGQAGGNLYFEYGDGENLLFSPDFEYSPAVIVEFEAKIVTDLEEGELSVFVSDNGWGQIFEDVVVNNEWQTYSTQAFDLADFEGDLYIMFQFYYDEYDIIFRNVKVKATEPPIHAPAVMDWSNYTGESFIINWSAVEGATGYLVSCFEWDEDYDEPKGILFENEQVAAEETSYAVTGIQPNTVYAFTVNAMDENGVSATPDPVTCAALVTPTNVTATIKEDNSGFDVKWDTVEYATNYGVNVTRIHTAASEGEVFDIANADFSSYESTGTVDEPQDVYNLVAEYPEMPGFQFILPIMAKGAVGVANEMFYTGFLGLEASIQSADLDLSGSADGKLYFEMTAASPWENAPVVYMGAFDEETGKYFYSGTPVVFTDGSKEFTKYEGSIQGCTEKCFITIQAMLNEETAEYGYEAGILLQDFHAWINMKDGSKVEIPYLRIATETTEATADAPLTEYDEFGVNVIASQYVDEEDGSSWLRLQSKPSEKIIVKTVGVDTIGADFNAEDAYYNMQGMRVARPAAGDILIKVTEGKATKVRF